MTCLQMQIAINYQNETKALSACLLLSPQLILPPKAKQKINSLQLSNTVSFTGSQNLEALKCQSSKIFRGINNT